MRKIVTFIAITALIGLVLVFSVLAFMAALAVGAIAWIYLWWKTRDLRKQMRMHPMNHVVVEGEVIRKTNSGDGRER